MLVAFFQVAGRAKRLAVLKGGGAAFRERFNVIGMERLIEGFSARAAAHSA
jgi:hypothetical protein